MPYTDDDADLRLVQERHVAVLGYGDDGPAHALSLRDSGVDVRVGLDADAGDRPQAEAEGLRVVTPYEACEEADLVVVLGPVSAQPDLYAEAINPNLLDGDALVFAVGSVIRDGLLSVPGGVDVCLVSSVANGELTRREYTEGRGSPVLLAVEQDATGQAWPLTLSYAKAMGGLRAGGIQTTFAETVDAARFGQQTLVGGALVPLIVAGFQTLADAGCSVEVAYLECVHRLREAVERLQQHGIDRRRSSGAPVVGPDVQPRLREALDQIRAGSHGEPTADTDAGQHPMDAVGRELRSMMPWLRHS